MIQNKNPQPVYDDSITVSAKKFNRIIGIIAIIAAVIGIVIGASF